MTPKEFTEKVNRILEQQKALVKPFPDDGDEAKKARREKGRKDIFWFARTYFPHYFTCDFAPFHKELHEMSTSGNQTLNGAAVPRKHGKSSFVTLLEPIHQTLFEISPFVLIIAGSEELAEPFITFIKLEFEENERLKQDFGDCITQGHWTSREIWIKNLACIMGVGIHSNFRGLRYRQRRPSLIVIDDIDEDAHVENIKYCKKICQKLIRAGFPSLEKSGTMIAVGTLLNKKSAFSQFLEHCREKSKELRERFGESNIKVIVYAAIENGKPLWEAAYTLEELERIKIQLGPSGWAAEMMNDPLDDSKFRSEWFQYITQDFILQRKRYWTYYSGSDPSARDTEKHDYKAHTVIAQDRETKKIYVVEAWGKKTSIQDFYEAFFNMYGIYQMVVSVFEEQGFQIYLKNDLEKYCRERHRYPNIKGVTHTTDKVLRIGRLEAPVARADILFIKHHSDQDLLLEQLHYLGTNMNDDLPDTLEMAVWGLENGGPTGKCRSQSRGRRNSGEIIAGTRRPSAILRREYYRN